MAGGAVVASCSKSAGFTPPPGTPDADDSDGGPIESGDALPGDDAALDAGVDGASAPDAGAPQPPPKPAPDAAAGHPDATAKPDAAADATPAAITHPPEFPAPVWLRNARVGGVDASLDPGPLGAALDAFAAQGVSVVELDSDLSFYLTDAQFTEQLGIIDAAATAAHMRGMKAVIYFPTFEVLTPNAAKVRTMSKDHPDWVQIDMTGKPNVFIGGTGRVFWVDPGTESAWMCPNTPYADYFIGRVEKLAHTSVDGLWGDVPLLADIAGVWPCLCTYCRARFMADTGLALPTAANWADATFRRWIVWRHKIVSDFEQKLVTRAKAARADFEVVIETVTMDYSGGTAQGLDGASHDDGHVYRVWEVDAVSDDSAMRNASAEDWIDMAVMMKHAAGASAPRPSWVFCYGKEAPDAEQVFGLAVATGNNPFELKIPQMATSVGVDYRKKVFTWLKGEDAIYASYPLNQTAVLFSSASRDFLDRNGGVGLYTSLDASDTLWWTTEKTDPAPTLPYLGDYRGWCKALIHAHVPFDVVPVSHVGAEGFSRYRTLVVPSAVSLSDAIIKAIYDFAAAGGTVITSGADVGIYDEEGRDRGNAALLKSLGAMPTEAWTKRALGKGAVFHGSDRIGLSYLRNENQTATMQLAAAIPAPQIVTDAPAATVISVRRTRDGRLVLLATNLDGLGTTTHAFTPREATISVGLALDGMVPTKATLSRPGVGQAALPFQVKDGRLQVSFKVSTISVVTVAIG